MTQVHAVKIRPEFYAAIISETKTSEFRRDDRGYKVWDYLLLQDHDGDAYLGHACLVRITHILREKDGVGVPEGYVVLSVKLMR